MQATVNGLAFLDIVSSTSFKRRDIDNIAQRLRETINSVVEPNVQAHLTGDGGILVFPSPERSYEGLKILITAWINAKDKFFFPPIVPGIRLALHVGMVETIENRLNSIVGLSLSLGSRLIAASPPDTVVLSTEAFDYLKKSIESDGFRANHQTLSGKHGLALDAFVIPIREFFKPDQYLIRIEPPTDLLLYLASYPEQLFAITPRNFEEIIAELLKDFGYQVELTKQTRDNGIDIIAISRDEGLGLVEKYLVQCKKNAPKNKVGIGVVHNLLGVGAESPSTGLIIATTSTFTQPAKALAIRESVRWRLHLKDYNDIREWLSVYAGKRTKK